MHDAVNPGAPSALKDQKTLKDIWMTMGFYAPLMRFATHNDGLDVHSVRKPLICVFAVKPIGWDLFHLKRLMFVLSKKLH